MDKTAEKLRDRTDDAGSVSLINALMGAFCNKYVCFSLTAVIMAFLTLLLGENDIACAADISSASIFMLAAWCVQYLWLRRYGISRKMMVDNAKSVDQRLAGSLGDLNSLGSTLGALAGITVVLSRLFIMNGGTFSDENSDIFVPIIKSVAMAFCIGTMISVITSKPSLRCSLYIIAGRTTGARGSELLKKTCRASSNEELMVRLRKMACIRTVCAVIVSITIVMSALSGVGSAFSCARTGFLCMLAVGLSGCCSKGGEEKLSDEKIPLFDKESRKRSVLNSISVILIAFMFIYSFPFRSVYTEYTPTYEYYYDDVVEEGWDFISIPANGDESAALLSGLFLIFALMISVISGSFALSSGFRSFSQISSEFIGAGIAFAASLCLGIAVPSAALDGMQYLVAASVACLLILVNMIAYLIDKHKVSRTE